MFDQKPKSTLVSLMALRLAEDPPFVLSRHFKPWFSDCTGWISDALCVKNMLKIFSGIPELGFSVKLCLNKYNFFGTKTSAKNWRHCFNLMFRTKGHVYVISISHVQDFATDFRRQ